MRNAQGGWDPDTEAILERAAMADLVTLPSWVPGTNCGNCLWIHLPPAGTDVGYCAHPDVQQPVTARMCCAYWDAVGTKRPWQEV